MEANGIDKKTTLTNQATKEYFTKPWYLQSWFIGLNFVFSFLVLPLISGIVLLAIDISDNRKKKRLVKNLNLDKLAVLDKLESEIETKLAEDKTIDSYQQAVKGLKQNQQEIEQAQGTITELTDKRIELESEIEMQEFGFYNPEKDAMTSSDHKAKIIDLQNKQKAMVKNKAACFFNENFTFNGSLSEGKKEIRKQVKIALWAFNTHCDNVIKNVTYRNRAVSEKKIRRAYELINEAFSLVSITHEYLALKLNELEITHVYCQKVEHEKELLREERAKEREERKLQQEIKLEKAKLEKDEKHINTEVERLRRLLKEESTDKQAAQKEIDELNKKLTEIDNKKEEVDYRKNHAKAGYVYIISNLGSFGDEVVKIGVTRRLDPRERVKELGDASVPFRFDTHALVFSENAYELERALHNKFNRSRVNAVNSRKEFFRVSLEEVKKAIESEFSATLEFDMDHPADEYRQSVTPTTKN